MNGINGYGSHQQSEALKAYDKSAETQRKSQTETNERAAEQNKERSNQTNVNKPIEGATVGGKININV